MPDTYEDRPALLELEKDLARLRPPAADPAFRLRTRNLMLARAARRRSRPMAFSARLRRAFAPPVVRVALTSGLVIAAITGGTVVAAASSLPGDPLYAVKTGAEEVQLALALSPGEKARLRLEFAQLRLEEATRLIALGRVDEGMLLIDNYGSAVAGADLSVSGLSTGDAQDLAGYLDSSAQASDTRLQDLAGTLQAKGDNQAAAAVEHARSRADQAIATERLELRGRMASPGDGSPGKRPGGGGRP